MANTLKNIQDRALTAGQAVYTVPASTTATLVGVRVANNDAVNSYWLSIDINGFNITGVQTPLPAGSALEVLNGSKIVLEAGDVVTAYSDADNKLDITISYLEQTT